MKILKSLTFGVFNATAANPVAERRTKLIAHLEEQKALANDPLFLRTEHRWVINDQGIKQRIEVKKRVRQWWRVGEDGSVALTVRYGAKAIEFEKGKNAILLSTMDQMLSTLDAVIEAVKAGELDHQLAQSARARGSKNSRRAA